MNSATYGQTLQLLMIVELYIKPEKISCSWLGQAKMSKASIGVWNV
jgi:hypothetical protein